MTAAPGANLPHRNKVVAIPTQAFAEHAGPDASSVRFAFCTAPRSLAQAATRLSPTA
ncbi:hypothetical protein ACFVT2_12480 [Streptomyces sp. NPDC058000]|uniref:hypothetical protein n=1 Tax=Streptomyces sp. NPDC058000 TaxID=3346299 RepID=UPI0036E26865